MGCVPTCNTGSLGTETILEKDPTEENSGSSLTVPVCTFPTTSDFFTEWGRVYEGSAGGCLLDGTKGSCRSYTYYTNGFRNNIYASTIKSMDSDGVTSYISGGLNSRINNDTYFSYTIYHEFWDEHITEKNTVCLYTAITPKFIVQFPEDWEESNIKYAKCIEIDSCPGTLHEDDDELIDNTPVRCKLTKLEAEANFGLTGEEGWCKGPTYGGCQFCNDNYAIYGWSDDYDISNNPEYFHHCARQPPKDESGIPESDFVCEKLYPEGNDEARTQFKCQHISGTISIYPIYTLDNTLASKVIRLINDDDSFIRNIYAPTAAGECDVSKKVTKDLGSGSVTICELKPADMDFLYKADTHCIAEAGVCLECENDFKPLMGREGTSISDISELAVIKCYTESFFQTEAIRQYTTAHRSPNWNNEDVYYMNSKPIYIYIYINL